jgi:hypothetical protein
MKYSKIILLFLAIFSLVPVFGQNLRVGAKDFEMLTAELDFKAGQSYDIPVTARNLGSVQGFQFTLFIDPKVAEIIELESGLLRKDNFGFFAKDGNITCSWNVSTPLTEDKLDDVLFTIKVQAKSNVVLSRAMNILSRPTEAEAYALNDEMMNVKLAYTPAIASSKKDELFQNMPNPFKDETLIPFYLPKAGKVNLSIRTADGRQVLQQNADFNKGMNQIRLTREQLQGKGLLYYSLEADGFSASKSMLLME